MCAAVASVPPQDQVRAAYRVAMANVQHGRLADSGELRHAGRNWFHSFLVPQWRQPSRNGSISGTLKELGADLHTHHDRERCTGGIWKRETTDIRPSVGSRNPCWTYTNLHVGKGLTWRFAKTSLSVSWRNIAFTLKIPVTGVSERYRLNYTQWGVSECSRRFCQTYIPQSGHRNGVMG